MTISAPEKSGQFYLQTTGLLLQRLPSWKSNANFVLPQFSQTRLVSAESAYGEATSVGSILLD
jgi:hypothetical protein